MGATTLAIDRCGLFPMGDELHTKHNQNVAKAARWEAQTRKTQLAATACAVIHPGAKESNEGSVF
jgi:hypothetical protein